MKRGTWIVLLGGGALAAIALSSGDGDEVDGETPQRASASGAGRASPVRPANATEGGGVPPWALSMSAPVPVPQDADVAKGTKHWTARTLGPAWYTFVEFDAPAWVSRVVIRMWVRLAYWGKATAAVNLCQESRWMAARDGGGLHNLATLPLVFSGPVIGCGSLDSANVGIDVRARVSANGKKIIVEVKLKFPRPKDEMSTPFFDIATEYVGMSK